MHITDINSKQTQNSKPKAFRFEFFDLFRVFVLSLFYISFFGYVQATDLQQAQEYSRQSEVYYQKAVGTYKDLIAKGKDLDQLHFKLGQLYYSHGEFDKAIWEFKKSNLNIAKKFLAISYYRMGNFTDAQEVFSKNIASDDEYLYYYGLTCEKLNLFDKAINIYKKIESQKFASLAQGRIEFIEKKTGFTHIDQIDPKISMIIAHAPDAKKYPQAGALILYCDEHIEITPQNTQVTYLHYVIKILNERGKQSFSETDIEYDSTYEKVELDYARTIRPDGIVIDIGSRHIRDVSKYLDFPLYSNVRARIISFPEVTEGAVIEYKLKIYRSELINKKEFVISYPIQSEEPIITANFSISLPSDRKLYIKTLNEKYNNFGADLKPKIEKKDNTLIYVWCFKNIPQIVPEVSMPAAVEINPSIMISTFNSWQEIYDWWWNLAKDKIRPDADIKAKVKELIQKHDSSEAKIRAIYNFCAQKIRYVAVEYGQAGYEPHFACDIFKNKYGDCKDQAILLVTMLKEAGFTAWPVLIGTKNYYNLDIGFPSTFFNHCIVAVLLNDKIIFLDPTAETCSFGDLPADDQNRRVLVFKENKYQIQNTPLYPADHNLLKQSIKIKINPKEDITAQKSIFTYGIYDQAQRHWLLYTQPELIEEVLKQKIQEISIGARLIDYNVRNIRNLNAPVVMSYRFKGLEYLRVAGPIRIMPSLTSFDTSIVAKESRRYAIDFGVLDSKETVFEVEIPSNFTVKYMPQSIHEDSRWFNFNAEYNYKKGKISFRQRVDLKTDRVVEQDYADFKTFVEALAKKLKQHIILEEVK